MLSQIDLQSLPFSVLGFAARSGTGKTTLLKQLIPELKKRGFRLGLIKHTHHKITFDNSGLTKKVFACGADVMANSPALSVAEWHLKNSDTALVDAIKAYSHLPIDILLIEGFKKVNFPKVELHRKALNKPLLLNDDNYIVAVASDDEYVTNSETTVPVLDINNIEHIADWVVEYANGANSELLS